MTYRQFLIEFWCMLAAAFFLGVIVGAVLV